MKLSDEQHTQLAELACVYAWARLGRWTAIFKELPHTPTMLDLCVSLQNRLLDEVPFPEEPWDKPFMNENLSVTEQWHREQTTRILNQHAKEPTPC